MSNFGSLSSTTCLRHVQLIPPNTHSTEAYRNAGWLEHSPTAAQAQFNDYMQLLKDANVTVSIAPAAPKKNPDAIYAYDNAIVLPTGAIVYRSCKPNRSDEHQRTIQDLQHLNIPIIGQINPPGSIDGGDIFWMGPNELAAGLSWRTNSLGLDQLQRLLEHHKISLFRYDLPNVTGPNECLHLMSLISPLSPTHALIDERYLPVRLIQDLQDRNISLIVAEPSEFESLATNVLALGKNRIVTLEGNPKTNQHLESAGFKIYQFFAPDLCIAGTGGPTCLTRVISRDLPEAVD